MIPSHRPVPRHVRILFADDSAVMRSLLRTVLTSAPDLEVAGAVGDGETALSAIESLHPDLVILDVEMPVMDGLVTLRQLRARGYRMPVIMCSSLTQRGARVTIEALAAGASDYVTKPQSQVNRQAGISALSADLIPRIRALTQNARLSPAVVAPLSRSAHFAPIPATLASPLTPMPVGPFSVLAIGVSTGGPAALDLLLPQIPARFPLPIIVVQHMPDVFTRLFAERLDSRCALTVREAADGDPIRPGCVYIARGNWHLEALAPIRPGSPNILHLNQAPTENHCRPAVDVLFRSLASLYGPGVLALVLTGMGSDGLAGCREIRGRGGAVLVQDQATSVVWGMPAAIANAGLAHRILPLNLIVPEVLQLVARTQHETPALREPVMHP